MDLFILDSLNRRTALFDQYESLIWTERFQAYGDFELVIHSTLEARNSFSPGTRLAINESARIMQVETVEDKTDDQGRTVLTVKGPSLEDILNDRVARDASIASGSTDSKWYLTGLPADVVRQIFKKICVDLTLDPGDYIPFYTAGNFYPADTIPEPPTSATLSFSPTTVYEAIKQICEVYDLGFRLVRNGDNSQLMFNIYTGNDRTTLQTALPAVIFSPELDNLSDVSFLTSISAYKNVADVYHASARRKVYADNVDPSVAGFERRVAFVDASSEDLTGLTTDQINALLDQKGKEALATQTTLSAFDGQIPANSQYIYHRDYELGDLVEIRNADKVTNNMRVTEQIFVSDAQGDRAYPTLSVKLLITPGSWYAWPAGGVWDDIVDPSVVWNTV